MNPKGCLQFILRATLIILVILIGLGVAGYFWEQSAEAADDEQYPFAGELYEIEGRMMHLNCQGDGEPTIILDAGLGGWSIDFADLQPILADQGRVCSYDRAGYGWSDLATGERNAQIIADDMIALLDAAAITDPVILVGFSFSGLHTRLIAIQHPERVQGLILLDPALESDNSLYDETLLRQQQSLVGLYGFFGSLAEVGVVRLLNPEEMAPSAPFIPQGQTARYYSRVSAPEWWYASQQEFSTLISGESATLIENAGNLPPDLPLVVIGIDTYPEGLPENIAAGRTENLQALAAQSTAGQYWVAEGVLHENLTAEHALILEAIAMMDGSSQQ